MLDQSVTIGGYGLSIENEPKSSGIFHSVTLRVIEPYGPSKILIWLKGRDNNMGSCTGDSGGPIMNDQGQLIGIISWAEGAGRLQCGALTQGILLGPQKKFIQRFMDQWQP